MNPNQPRLARADILIVNYESTQLNRLSSVLIQQGYRVRKAISGRAALQIAQITAPDLILLNTAISEQDSYELCQQLKSHQEIAEVPVIFLNHLGSKMVDKTRIRAAGGADSISHPFQVEEVLKKIEYHLTGSARQQEVLQHCGQFEVRVETITKQLSSVKAQLTSALHDKLTGLPNRVAFLTQLEYSLQRIQTERSYQFAILFLSCDRFKIINSSLGSTVGDELLNAFVSRLQTCLSRYDSLARVGDDEFAILLSPIQALRDAVQVANQIRDNLTHPFYLPNCEVFLSASIGIVAGSGDYVHAEHILRDAETAMCRAQELGNDRCEIFDFAMREKACRLLQLETDLRKALNRQEFRVYYQPIIATRTGKIAGLEALLRWQHPVRGVVSPAEFIPVAEETGLIAPIGNWVLREACRQLREWQKDNRVDPDLTISVNFSARQFTQPNLIDQIDEILAETQLNPQCLKLEITESAIMENPQSAALILQQLRERQIQLSLDDFGIGYSSLSYLHSFPVDTLKVDKSFVQRLDGNPNNLGIIPAIMCIARRMGMNVVAEGIETPEQLEQLKALRCNFSQGYLFSRPLEGEKVIELIASNPQW